MLNPISHTNLKHLQLACVSRMIDKCIVGCWIRINNRVQHHHADLKSQSYLCGIEIKTKCSYIGEIDGK